MPSRSSQLMKSRLTALLIAGVVMSAAMADRHVQRADDLDTRLQQQMGEVDFPLSGRPRSPFLVVLVDVTREAAVARDTGAELILGQPKRNSATVDLIIELTAGDDVISSYIAADPRFQKMDDWARNEARSAVMRVFVPLDAGIDRVSIRPAPGRGSTVSAGGDFDPRPLMKSACLATPEDERGGLFPACDRLGAMVFRSIETANGGVE